MKKWLPLLAFAAALMLSQSWWRLELLLNPIDKSQWLPGEVIIYTTAWCPYCVKTRSYLRTAGVAFTEHDIEKSPSAYRRYQQLGGRGVPVLEIGNQVIHGYDRQAIRAALETGAATPLTNQ